MATKLTPGIKGLLTALLMIGMTLLLDKFHDQTDPRLQYLVFVVYAVGIIWTLLPLRGSFGELFSKGFRCFIVITLVMVLFTFIFIKLHPEWAEQEKKTTIEYYSKQGDNTPAELEEMGKKAKKQYPVAVVSLSIFRYLIIGAALTAGTAAILTRRK